MPEDMRLGLSYPNMANKRNVCRVLNFSDEVFTLIASKLPLQMIFQLKCVCKTWNTFFSSESFLKHFFGLLSQTPIFTVALEDGFAAYSFEIKSWHKWTSAFLSKHFTWYKVYGEVGDLLLVGDGSVENEDCLQNLYVANPTKRSQRKLSSLPEIRHLDPFALGHDAFVIGLIPGESSKSFKVFIGTTKDARGDNVNSQWSYRTHLYDSELDSWETTWPWQELAHGEKLGDITFYEEALHGIKYKVERVVRFFTGKTVCRYDEQTACWLDLSTEICEGLCFERLFEWQGHLMLIGGRDGGEPRKPRLASVHIWQLDKYDHIWVEHMRMPEHIVDHFGPSEINDTYEFSFSPQICGHRICLTNNIVVYKQKKCEYKSRYVMCDLCTSSWWEVPEPPFSPTLVGFSLLTPN